MGQAKLRGTREERVAEAKARQADNRKGHYVRVGKVAGKSLLVAAMAMTATELFIRGMK